MLYKYGLALLTKKKLHVLGSLLVSFPVATVISRDHPLPRNTAAVSQCLPQLTFPSFIFLPLPGSEPATYLLLVVSCSLSVQSPVVAVKVKNSEKVS